MKVVSVKILLVLSQAALLSGFISFFVLKTALYFILSSTPLVVLVVLGLRGALDCIHCGAPLWDPRTIGRWVPVKPSVVDRCGECGRPLFK